MTAFRNWRVRSKLAVIFVALLLPLLAAEAFAIGYFRQSLRETAEENLTNLVLHLRRLCSVQIRQNGGTQELTPETLASLQEIFSSLQVGETGYPYCMDTGGTLVLHPSKAGQNISDSRDSQGIAFIQEICRHAPELGPDQVGTIRYPWRNEEAGERRARMKILTYTHLPETDWIIAAGSYEEEVFAAVERLGLYTSPLVAMSFLLVGVLTVATERMITRPLARVSSAAARMSAGDLGARVDLGPGGDEFARLGRSFDAMADQVREKTEEMERLIQERTEALRDSRERYRSLVESTVDGIVTTDLHGTVTFVNRGLQTMLGYEAGEMAGRPIWEFYTRGRPLAEQIMDTLRAQGSLSNREMELVGKERVVPIRTSASILRDHGGRERGTLGIFSDISPEKALQAELRQTQMRLIQTAKLRALGDLVSGVAHEINNPLMASDTMLHVMQTGTCPEGCANRDRMEILRRCNERIGTIVNHLRDFSRQAPLELRDLDVRDPLANALLITGQQLRNHQIEVEIEVPPDLPAVQGDSGYLEQVFLDLIANARDALAQSEDERKVILRARRAELDGRPAVAVEIADTGPGVPVAIRDQIFEPFFTTKGVGDGTGLGLSIAYGIVDEHGGRIDVEDNTPRGAIFRVTLPAAQASGTWT